uniref:Uncharacterized protein n=1 Tax=Caenorhabditis japonica TaxID=281687 RepID=A0A8R1EH43_CAEJA
MAISQKFPEYVHLNAHKHYIRIWLDNTKLESCPTLRRPDRSKGCDVEPDEVHIRNRCRTSSHLSGGMSNVAPEFQVMDILRVYCK